MWARGTALDVTAARAAARVALAEPADLGRIETLYARVIARAYREAAAELLVADHALAAAADPAAPWRPPAPFALRLLDDAAAAAEIEAMRVWNAKAKRVLTATGLPWDVRNTLAEGAAVQFGTQITAISERTRLAIMQAIDQAWADGLSIPDTSALLREAAAEIGKVRAAAIARTELLGIVNGANLAGVLLANSAAINSGDMPLFRRKGWLSTLDGRTRPTHAAANGQTVAIDSPFTVGGYALSYPGDPLGPAAEVVNCRCTTTWED